MRPSVALEQHREEIRKIVIRHNARNARVFGSALTNSDKDDSDLDLLVDPYPGMTLLDLGSLQVELEEKVGVPIDLLTPSDLPIKFRKQVLEQAKPV